MLSLMKQHGRMILCCVAAVLVLSVAFRIPFYGNTGALRGVLGKAMEGMESVDVRSYKDTDAVLAVAARSKPEITYAYVKTVSGTAADLNAMFSAVDAEGNSVTIEITDVLDISGTSILYETEEHRKNNDGKYDTAGFLFPSAGIYTVCVKAVDTENKASCGQYKIPVAGN